MTNILPSKSASKAKRFLFNSGQYFLCYLAGIIACVIFTPVELMLLNAPMWLFFVPFAPIGYFFYYFDLPPQYVFGSNIFLLEHLCVWHCACINWICIWCRAEGSLAPLAACDDRFPNRICWHSRPLLYGSF